ncbi:uncharacterized protein LOC132263853 [Phlebotomus argentipes]|uniref:uncharacterized protein LOC132263853 n=1 Tax=Phlebotomus argentipes TaxID=94469 RepID=UPI0028934B91|nr:uncharacterized protein LOC132263853 [Phlebotomus argentipes]
MVHRVSSKDDITASSSGTRLPKARPRKRESRTVTKTVSSTSNRSSKNTLAVEKDENGGEGKDDSGWTTKSRGRSSKGCVQVLLEEPSARSVPSVVVEKVMQKASSEGMDKENEEENVRSSEVESESSDEEDSDGDTDDNVSISNLMRKQKCDLDDCVSDGVAKALHVRCSLPLHRLSHGVVETLTNGGNRSKYSGEPSNGNKFLCLFCDRSFVSYEIRSKHADRLHRSVAGRRASARNVMNVMQTEFAGCPFCNNAKIFSGFATDLVGFFHHMIEKHSDRYFGCRECSIRLSTSEAFQKHRESVHNIIPGGVRETPNLGEVDFEDSILASSISKLPAPKTSVDTAENGSHQGRKMMTRLSKMNKKHQLLRNEEPMLSRLGVAQNRSPRTRMGSKGRVQIDLRSAPEASSCTSGRISRSKSGRTTNTSGGGTGANESGDFGANANAKSSGSKEILSSNFDDDFYETVSVNVRKNLSCYLDGKIGSDPENPSVYTRFAEAVPTVPSTVVRSSYMTDNEIHEATSLSAITAFPTLLTAEQYGTECVSPNKNKRTITKNSWKWKWDFVKKYKYVNEGGKIVKKVKQQTSGLRDLSKLDMWTQLTMRTKHEIVQRSGSDDKDERQVDTGDVAREEKRKIIEQLNTILDTRLLPQIVLEQNDQRLIKVEPMDSSEELTDSVVPSVSTINERVLNEEDNFVATLNLQRSNSESAEKSRDVILSGEWARPRCYVCFGCGAKFETIKSLEEHKNNRHPHVYSTHYEIVGRELIEGELYKHFFIPTKALRRKTEFLRQVSSDDSGTVEDSMDSTTSCTISTKCDSFDTDTNSRMSNKFAEVTVCTKCKKECTGMMDLYRHMLDCVGDYAWLIAKRRLRHRYYGNRSRRRRANAKLLRFGCLRTPKPPKTPENRAIPTQRKQSPQTPRTRPSDADSIQRMLANLPAKRSSRSVHPAKPLPMRRRKLIASATTTKFTKRNTRTSILAAKSSTLLLRSKNKSEGSKPISKHRQQSERVTRSGNTKATLRKIGNPKRVTRSSHSPNTHDVQLEGVTTRNKTKHFATPVQKGAKTILNKLSKKYSKSQTKAPTTEKDTRRSKNPSTSLISKKSRKVGENYENGQKNGKTKKIKANPKADNSKKNVIPTEKEEPFLEQVNTSDQDDLVEIKDIMDSIIDRASVAFESEDKENESIPSTVTSTPSISLEVKTFETPVHQKTTDHHSLVSPTSATPGKKRIRKLTDCIARLTDKIQEKFGIPFLDNTTNNILAKPAIDTECATISSTTEEVQLNNNKKSQLIDPKSKDDDIVHDTQITQVSQKDHKSLEEEIIIKSDPIVVVNCASASKEINKVLSTVTITPEIHPEVAKSYSSVSVIQREEVTDVPLNLTVRKPIEDPKNSQPICLVKHPEILKIPVVAGHIGGRIHPGEIDCNVVIDLSTKSARTISHGTSKNAEKINLPPQMEVLANTQANSDIISHSQNNVITQCSEISIQTRTSEILHQPRCSDVISHPRSTEILKQPRPELIAKRVNPIIQIPQVPLKNVKPKQKRKPRAKAAKTSKTGKDLNVDIKSSEICENTAEKNKNYNNNIPNVSQVNSAPATKASDSASITSDAKLQSLIVAKSTDLISRPAVLNDITPTEDKMASSGNENSAVGAIDTAEKQIKSTENDNLKSNSQEISGQKEQLSDVLAKEVEDANQSGEVNIAIDEQQILKGKKSPKVTKGEKFVLLNKEHKEKAQDKPLIQVEKTTSNKRKVTILQNTKGKNKAKSVKSEILNETTVENTVAKNVTKNKPKGKILKSESINQKEIRSTAIKKRKNLGTIEIVDSNIEDAAAAVIKTGDIQIKRRLEIVIEDVLKSGPKKIQNPNTKGNVEVAVEIVKLDLSLADDTRKSNEECKKLSDFDKISVKAATKNIETLQNEGLSVAVSEKLTNINSMPKNGVSDLKNNGPQIRNEDKLTASSTPDKDISERKRHEEQMEDSTNTDIQKVPIMQGKAKKESKAKGKRNKNKICDDILAKGSQRVVVSGERDTVNKPIVTEEQFKESDSLKAAHVSNKGEEVTTKTAAKGRNKVQPKIKKVEKTVNIVKSALDHGEKLQSTAKPRRKEKIEKTVLETKTNDDELEVYNTVEPSNQIKTLADAFDTHPEEVKDFSNPDKEHSLNTGEKSKPAQKPRKKRKNELAAIIADQLMESFKEVDKSRIDELKILHDLTCDANSNGDELLVSNAMEMVTTTKRKVTNKSNFSDSIPNVSAKKASKEIATEITTPKILKNEIASQFYTPSGPSVNVETQQLVDVPAKPKKTSQSQLSEPSKMKIISKEKKDAVMSNLLKKLDDNGEENTEDSSNISSATSKSFLSKKKKSSSIGQKKIASTDMEINSENEMAKASLQEVNDRVADSLNLLAVMDMNTQKSVETHNIESDKTMKSTDWVSRVVSLPKTSTENNSKTVLSTSAKPKFILKPSRLQALKTTIPDLFDEVKNDIVNEDSTHIETDIEKKNGENVETVAKLVDKIRESTNQSDSDDDTCLAEIAKSLNNRILTSDEFTNVADTLPVAETPSENLNHLINLTSQNRLNIESNTDAVEVDVEMEDGMSVFTSASMDSGITASGTKGGPQKISVVKKRKMRRSVLYKSKKPKASKNTITSNTEPMSFFCDICKKDFSRQDRLTKHKMTITHIAKLSEQEFLDAQKNRMAEEKENESQNVENVNKTPITEEKKDNDVDEKVQEIEENKILSRNPVQYGIEPISSPELVQVPPSMDRYPSPVRSINPGTPRLNLSQEEKLFYECCNMLKGSNRIGAQSENKSLTPKSNEQSTNCFGGSHNAVYCVKSPMSHRRSSPKHAYPKIDNNQFSDISSDSNPMFSRPTKFAQSKGVFEDADSVNNQLSGFLATAEKFLSGAASTSNSIFYNDKLIESTPPISGANPKEPSPTGRSYSESFSDMGDSFPSSQDASESEHYAQTILDRSGSNKAMESEVLVKEGNDSLDRSRKLVNDKHLSERSIGSPINSRASSQCSSVSKVRTKGAMKGYDSFKVSIPTNGLDLQQALVRNPHVNSKLATLADIALSTDIPVITKDAVSSKQEDSIKPCEFPVPVEESAEIENLSKNAKVKKTKDDVGNRLGFRAKKRTSNKDLKDKVDSGRGDKALEKNPLDVYEFEESKDSVDTPILPLSKRTIFRPNTELDSTKNPQTEKVSGVEKNKNPEAEDNASQMSSTSFSDRDDFNYNSNLSDSDSEIPSASPKLPAAPGVVKKTKKLPDPAQKKSLIMGRIFRNAQKNRPTNDVKTTSYESENSKKPFLQKQELDKLFDSLKSDVNSEDKDEAIEEPQKFEEENESNTDSVGRSKKSSTSAEARRSSANRKSRELAMFEAEWGMSLEQIEEIIGIGKRKSQRKCAVGKQKILAETWSSDEYEEFQSTKDIIALIQEKELKSSQRALRNQRRRESQRNQTVRSQDNTKVDHIEELGAETWDVRRALGLEYKKARGSKKAVRIAGGSDVETSQKTQNPPERPAKIKKRRQTFAFHATEPSPERDIPIRNAGKRRGSAIMRGSTSDGESGGRKPKKVKFPESSKDKDDATWTPSRPMARSKRVASEMLYYWSSSSDDEFGRINNSRDDDDDLSQDGEVLQQHGWIVGDSHKKLVTLLAHAKGKKTEECSVKETSSGNNKKKS